ncbi:hypothetical protein MTR_8g058870 [Medicago truncatula]|uniref:Retroviral polymerase SH3-like domain-containing protein n=1 Tax=Medicago truncatula TaxID=3880 RepID=A0A072TQF4_MEDTR|nr:hypothetical protein MTR_8g058870 [Medicago truncatula]
MGFNFSSLLGMGKVIDKPGKFDAKVDDGIFLGYSSNSKAYRVFNKRTLTVEESIHVAFDEKPSQEVGKAKIDSHGEQGTRRDELKLIALGSFGIFHPKIPFLTFLCPNLIPKLA